MTDEKIKDGFEMWKEGTYTESEGAFLQLLGCNNFLDSNSDLAAGFYAGFRTAERLAKIEVLESLWTRCIEERLDCSDIKDLLDRMLDELKAN